MSLGIRYSEEFPEGGKIMQERRYDVDWLRVIAMLAIFLFHCTRFFDTEGWELKNPEQSEILFVLMRGLIWPWVMELFFLLSGVGTWYALKSRRAGAYVWERVKRLLIPLYTVGLVVLLPVQFYFKLYTDSGYRGSFWQILPRYFASFRPPRITPWPSTLLPIPFSGHLWFLQFLFLISLVSLPLLLYIKSERGQRRVARLAGWCEGRGGIFLFLIPLCLVRIGLQGLSDVGRGWADFIWYTVFFVIGYMMASDRRFTVDVRKQGWICLALWIVGFCATGFLVFVIGYNPMPGAETFSLAYVFFQTIYSIMSWGAVVFVLNIGARYLNTNPKVLAYGNEAVLPFYLFHQTIILCVGWYVVRWDMGIPVKLLIVVVICFPLIIILYELLVRRLNVVRFFFGMRPKKSRLQRPPGPRKGVLTDRKEIGSNW
jgi:peptidoglycan/LPS O-acetylase OafA/YrhL